MDLHNYVYYDKKIEDFFEIGKDLETFQSKPEMINKIKELLKDEEKRKKMVHNAFKKSKQYTYYERAKDILEVVNEKA